MEKNKFWKPSLLCQKYSLEVCECKDMHVNVKQGMMMAKIHKIKYQIKRALLELRYKMLRD